MKIERNSALRLVCVTAPEKEAEHLARTLLKDRLIACANLVPSIVSYYWWKNKIERGHETLLVMKAPKRNMKKLLARMKKLHSYSVPEFIALPVRESNPDYETWALREARQKGDGKKGKQKGKK